MEEGAQGRVTNIDCGDRFLTLSVNGFRSNLGGVQHQERYTWIVAEGDSEANLQSADQPGGNDG